MVQEIRAARLPAAVADERPAEEVERAVLDVDAALDRLWRLLTSMRFALVLILVMAALGLAGTVLVQAPAGVLTDSQAKAAWLEEVRPKYGGWTSVLDALGLFSVFQSIWFRAVAAALTISTLACSIHRIPGIWKTVNHPHVTVGEAFFEHAPHRGAAVVARGTAATQAALVEALAGRRYRTIVEDGDAVHLYADRFRWVPFAGLIGHFALVIVVAGALVGGAFGFRDPEFILAEGSTAAVPTKPGVTVQLVSFRDSYYAETGAPSDYASELVLFREGQEVGRHTVRVNEPLRYEDISFYQSFYGPAAAMRVLDASGQPVFEGGVALAWRAIEGNRRVGSFTLADQGVTVWVVGNGGPDDQVVRPGQMRVEVRTVAGDTAVGAASLDPGKPAEIGGLRFVFERERQFTGLSVAKDPGAPLVWLGCTLLFFGFVARFTIPHRRLWARIVRLPDGRTSVSLAGVGRGDDSLGREIAGLVDEIERGSTPRHAREGRA